MSKKLSPQDVLTAMISELLEKAGYELVHLEMAAGRQSVLRLYIDRLGNSGAVAAVGVEDCIAVTRMLEEPLENSKELEAAFKGTYELEVSSPGLERPLRTDRDFERFQGCEARIHVFRPLSADELANPEFQTAHPRQKSFYGVIQGIQADGDTTKVVMSLRPEPEAKKARKKSGDHPTVTIPRGLITKAHLEPQVDWSRAETEGAES